MFQYTDKNHFRFGYMKRPWFQVRQSPSDQFIAKFGRATSQIESWREANRLACLSIRQNFEGDIWVLFSGGTDSEICIRSFYDAQIPIKVATLRFNNDLNQHDLSYVEKLRRELNLDICYFDLDVLEFFDSQELIDIVDPISCVSPILACHLWLSEQISGVPVIAQGEPYLRKDIPLDYVPGVSPYLPSTWRLVESERLCSLYSYFILKNRPAVPGFFQYTPEQFLSYLAFNPILKDLIDNKIIGKLGTRTSKNAMAYQYYPEVEPREKFTGFEKIEKEHDMKRSELAKRFPFSDQNYYIEYQNLLADLLPLNESYSSCLSNVAATDFFQSK